MKKRMKKRLIAGSLMLCCMALVTAVGSVFAGKPGEEKQPDVFLSSKHYNMKIIEKETEYKHTESSAGLEYKNENLNGKSGDHLQALIMTPILIVQAFEENPVIVSRQ